jgi:hypothetical protein
MRDQSATLPEHKVVPFWILPTLDGAAFNLAKQRGRAHLILLVCGPQFAPYAFLQDLAPRMTELRTLPARGLVVVGSADSAERLRSTPFTVLIDAEGTVRERYLPTDASAGVFVLDRYGTLYHQWLVMEPAELPPASDVVDWITAVGMQCSV